MSHTRLLWKINLTCPTVHVSTLTLILEPFVESTSYYMESESEILWSIECFSSQKPEISHIKNHALHYAPHLIGLIDTLKLECMKPKNWLEENFKALPPICVGSFLIYGSHCSPIPAKKNQIYLKIDASTAFGSGYHETTRGCLKALEDLFQEGPWENTLDLGCGSGILALATASLHKKYHYLISVLACDVNLDAVQMTKNNIKLNKFEHLIKAIQSDGFQSHLCQQQSPYDLIVANILTEPLKSLALDMYKMMQDKGNLILSGILQIQATSLKENYIKKGFILKKEYPLGEWVTLLFQKHI